jgi:hypothetical protein
LQKGKNVIRIQKGSQNLPNFDYFTINVTDYYDEEPTITVENKQEHYGVQEEYVDGSVVLTAEYATTGKTFTYLVSATDIKGFDTSTEGTKECSVYWTGYRANFSIEVSNEKTYTLTLSGDATFEGGTNTVELKAGEALPAITGVSNVYGWYNVDDPTEFWITADALGENTKSNATVFTMPTKDITIAPYSITTVNASPRTGSTGYYLTSNTDDYAVDDYGTLSTTRTLYILNSSTVKSVSYQTDGKNNDYVLTSTNGNWTTNETGKNKSYFTSDRIFTKTFTNYGTTTVRFQFRIETYNARLFSSDWIELAPGETYTYVYFASYSWLSNSQISNSTTSFELFVGTEPLADDYEALLVLTAAAATLDTKS